jgi:hypothetical protein
MVSVLICVSLLFAVIGGCVAVYTARKCKRLDVETYRVKPSSMSPGIVSNMGAKSSRVYRTAEADAPAYDPFLDPSSPLRMAVLADHPPYTPEPVHHTPSHSAPAECAPSHDHGSYSSHDYGAHSSHDYGSYSSHDSSSSFDAGSCGGHHHS